MKKILSLFFLLAGICSCSTDEISVSPENNDEEQIVRISMGGEISGIYEEPLTETKGEVTDVPYTLFAFQLYSSPENEEDYTPYAYGIFDQINDLYFNSKQGYKYKLVATAVRDAQSSIYSSEKNGETYYGLPFDEAISNKFILSEEELSGLSSGTSAGKDKNIYTLPATNRYYGEVTNIIPSKNQTVYLLLKRVVFGMKYQVKGGREGNIIVQLGGSPALSITPDEHALESLYTFNNVYKAWSHTQTEVPYTETHELKIYEEKNGSRELLITREIACKRKIQTIINITLGDGGQNIGIEFEDGGFLSDGGDEGAGLTFTGSVTLTTQEEVNEFGKLGFTTILGTLTINGAEISDLSPLENIKTSSRLIIENFTSVPKGQLQVSSDMMFELKKCTLPNVSFLKFSSTQYYINIQNCNLDSFLGCESIIEINSQINITNSKIESFKGFENIISCYMFVISSSTVNSFTEFHNLKNIYIFNESSNIIKTIAFPSLETAGRFNLYSSSIHLSDNSFPKLSLIQESFYIKNISHDDSEIFPSLTEAQSLSIDGIGYDYLNLFPLLEIVHGDLSISSIESRILKFDNLKYVGGNIKLSSCKNLQGCDGFEKLISIQNDLIINGCNIANLHGFDNLKEVGGEVDIYNCNQLVNIDDLNQLEKIGGRLRIYNCDLLTNISGFNHLSYLGELYLYGSNITSIGGFSTLSSIEGDMYIQASKLTNCTAFENLYNVNGKLDFYCTSLSWMDNLNVFTNVGGILLQGVNPALDRFQHINGLRGDLQIKNNTLSSFTGLNNIRKVDGNVIISGCNGINNLSDLNSLTHIGGNLEITSSSGLVTIAPLEHITHIGKNLQVSSCSGLISFPDVPSELNIKGYLIVEKCNKLSSVSGLTHANSIGRLIKFVDNPLLNDFSAFAQYLDHEHEFYASGNGSNPTKNDLLNN